MLRLTFTLAVALYAGFVIWGKPSEEVASATVQTDVLQLNAEVTAIVLETEETPRAEVTRAETSDFVVPDPATIVASTPAPSDILETGNPLGEPRRISLVNPAGASTAAAAPEPAAPTAEAGSTTSDLLQVTGSRVNLRAGPSTGTAVVDSLVRGTVVEALGDPVDGWLQLRDVTTGATGYMASRFVAPAG